MYFWHSLAFSMIQQMLAIWSLVPLHFLNACGVVWRNSHGSNTQLLHHSGWSYRGFDQTQASDLHITVTVSIGQVTWLARQARPKESKAWVPQYMIGATHLHFTCQGDRKHRQASHVYPVSHWATSMRLLHGEGRPVSATQLYWSLTYDWIHICQ